MADSKIPLKPGVGKRQLESFINDGEAAQQREAPPVPAAAANRGTPRVARDKAARERKSRNTSTKPKLTTASGSDQFSVSVGVEELKHLVDKDGHRDVAGFKLPVKLRSRLQDWKAHTGGEMSTLVSLGAAIALLHWEQKHGPVPVRGKVVPPATSIEDLL